MTISMRISFPICLTVFVAGWFSGCLFVLVSLDPERVALLLSPLTSKLDARPATMFSSPAIVLDQSELPIVPSYEPPRQHHEYEFNSEEVEDEAESSKEGANEFILAESEGIKQSEVIASSSAAPAMLAVESTSNAAVYAHNVLTNYAPSKVMANADGRWIIMDWAVDDRLFTVENYKALESLLSVYPNSIVRVILAAPKDAYAHKTGNQLSIMHFIKYKRKGYDIDVLPCGMVKTETTKEYSERWLKKCCFRCNSKCRVSDHVQPYHVLTYIRLNKLYRRGGLFSDFTFMFLGPLEPPDVIQGFYMNTFCNKQENFESWQVEQQKKRVKGMSRQEIEEGIGMWKVNKCFTSTLLVFNVQRSPVVQCMIDKYSDPVFILCVEDDSIYDGAYCISSAFNDCFRDNGVRNDLEVTVVTAAPALTEDVSSHESNNTSRRLLARNNPKFRRFKKIANIAPVHKHEEFLETFNNDPEAASQAMVSTEWTIAPYKRVLWLGALGWSGHWSSLPYPQESLLDATTKTFKLKKNEYEARPECKVSCSHYSKKLGILEKFDNPSYETGIEEAACAPTVIVPGFMKAASTFLFSAITMHPQVLPPLKGAQLKETYCYHPTPVRKIMKRPWCFPYIEENENFITADGTVYYATDQTVATSLLQDNKNVKAVFAVRQPTDRIYSNYKFSYETYSSKGSLDDLIERGMDRNDKFGVMREMVLNGTSDEALVSFYYNAPLTMGGALGVLFMHSLAFPAILHYRKILGTDNVMVVNSEDLSVKNMTRLRIKMNEVFSFLGLCPFEIPEQMDPALPGRNVIPDEDDMSQDMWRRVTKFFAPFNDALSRVTGMNLSHWNTKKAPSSLRPFITGRNDSLPPAWFEMDESGGKLRSEHKGLLQLIQHKAEGSEDSSFNTTFGMITMFR